MGPDGDLHLAQTLKVCQGRRNVGLFLGFTPGGGLSLRAGQGFQTRRPTCGLVASQAPLLTSASGPHTFVASSAPDQVLATAEDVPGLAGTEGEMELLENVSLVNVASSSPQ